MNFLFWNCRGAGNKGFCAVMHDLRGLYRNNILAVVEPRVSGLKADKIVEKLNYESSFRVEALDVRRDMVIVESIKSQYKDS